MKWMNCYIDDFMVQKMVQVVNLSCFMLSWSNLYTQSINNIIQYVRNKFIQKQK